MAIVHKKLREQAVDEIVRFVREGGLSPGDPIPAERDLTAMLGVSRTVVREALTSLEMQGMLELVPGRPPTLRKQFGRAFGNTLQYILDSDADSIVQLLEVRRMVEVEVAAFAAQRARPSDLKRLEAALERMEQHIDEPEGYIDADAEFHDALLAAAGNDLLVHMLSPVGALLARSRELTVGWRRPPTNALIEHRQIFERVRARDEVGARELMIAHLNETSADLSACLVQARPARRTGRPAKKRASAR